MVGVAVISVAVVACSGGGGGDATPTATPTPTPTPGIPANPFVNDTSSYGYARTGLHVGRQSIRTNGTGFVHGIARADFDGDGDQDVVLAPGDGTASNSPLEAFRNEAGAFVPDETILAAAGTGTIHTRKAIVGDYDGDGRPDAFMADHGFDQPPFPGAPPVLLLSGSDGRLTAVSLPAFAGYNHAAASADIDADGDLDIVVTAAPTTDGPWFMRNDGNGTFTKDTTLLPAALVGEQIYTSELIDVDEDGWVDLLLSGHEQDGFASQIRWGSPSGDYDGDVTTLPAVAGYGITLDLDAEDLDGDGDRDLVLTRTGHMPFYVGYSLQVLMHDGARAFADETATRIPGVPNAGGQWFDFVRLVDTDANGSNDILVDDRDRNMRWVNDGAGNFTLTTVF